MVALVVVSFILVVGLGLFPGVVESALRAVVSSIHSFGFVGYASRFTYTLSTVGMMFLQS